MTSAMNWILCPPLRRGLALAALASLLLNAALLVPSLYMLQVFDRVFSSRSLETLTMLTLVAALALALAWAMDRARATALAHAGRLLDEVLAPAALESLLSDAATAGRRVDRRVVHDAARLRQFLAGPAVQALFDAPWMPLYLGLIALLHPALGALAAGCAIVLLGLGLAAERLLRADTEVAAQAGTRAGRHVEALTRHAEVLLGMGMMSHALQRWGDAHREVLVAQSRAGEAAAALAALGRIVRQAVQVAMLGLGAWLVVANNASPGIMVAATILVARALQPVDHLIAGWKSLLEVRAAWRRLQDAPAQLPQCGAMQLPAARGALSVERATLLAPQPQAAPILKAIQLEVAPGECLGVIGPSGSGKTSLVRLLLGLRRPQAGAVRLDGIDLAAWPREQHAQALGYLPQDVELFDGTVAQNIARLGPVDGERVVAAARLAGIHDMVSRLPQAYDTEIGEDGASLSGGQRQRIALARAVYGLPKLVVLDEPNASLDHDGEQALSAAIAALRHAGSTVVLVSHRPSLMRHADRLAVLRDGALEAIGPRDEVLARLAGRTVHPLRRGAPQPDLAAPPIGAQA
jgi:PrtD family type I secretion system ABC transporter